MICLMKQEDINYLIISGIRRIMVGFIHGHKHVITKPSLETLTDWYYNKLCYQTHCPHCDVEFPVLGNMSPNTRNIDRIDNDKKTIETVDDLEMICKKCNSGKNNLSREEYRNRMFVRKAKNLYGPEKPLTRRASMKNTKSFYDENGNFIKSDCSGMK